MVELVERASVDEILQRALNQAARELLLAQSSDWAFIITTGDGQYASSDSRITSTASLICMK